MKNPKDAIRCFEKALELDPSDAESWEHKGNAITCLDIPDQIKYEDALACYDRAHVIKPTPYLLITKKEILSDLGRYYQGFECVNEAWGMELDNSEIWYLKSVS